LQSSTFTFKDKDEIEIFVYKWEPESPPKAVVQIIHGLAEHAKRYTRVAEALCSDGYVCYANDARGHGRTAGDLTEKTLEGNAGVLGPNGWRGVVNDIHELTNIIKKGYPNLPIFLIGHSWGLVIKAGKLIIKGDIKKRGPSEPSQKMHDMNFKSNNHDWQNDEGATGFEWLSRDREEVQKYIDDPLCGFVSPASLWLEFLSGFEKIYDSKQEQKIRKDLPIYFISGSLCVIGNKTKWVMGMINRLKKYGMKDVTYKFYQDARHEIFNEINRDEVYHDVINWLNSHM
jgi:alpha-beta hydrolase superfamily lysophospholipase